MKTRHNPLTEVNLIAKLADLQEADYHNTVVLHAVIDLLIQKGIITRDELLQQARTIDAELTPTVLDVHARSTERQPQGHPLSAKQGQAVMTASPDNRSSEAVTTPPAL